MTTFLLVVLVILAVCGWLGLLFRTGWALLEALDGGGDRRSVWTRFALLSAVLIVVTGAVITWGIRAAGDSCPAGTTREYKATGYKTGYHYCLAEERP